MAERAYVVLRGIRLDGTPETVLVAEDEYQGPPDDYLTLGASQASVAGLVVLTSEVAPPAVNASRPRIAT